MIFMIAIFYFCCLTRNTRLFEGSKVSAEANPFVFIPNTSLPIPTTGTTDTHSARRVIFWQLHISLIIIVGNLPQILNSVVSRNTIDVIKFLWLYPMIHRPDQTVSVPQFSVNPDLNITIVTNIPGLFSSETAIDIRNAPRLPIQLTADWITDQIPVERFYSGVHHMDINGVI